MSPIKEANRLLNTQYNSNKLLYNGVPYLILVSSLIALYGWSIGKHYLVSVSPAWVSIKPLTALCFIFSGISMIFHVYQKPRMRDFVAGWFNCISIGIATAWLSNKETLNIITNYEELRGLEPYTFIEGLPSWMTILCFFLFSISYFFEEKRPISIMLMVISVVAIIGYGVNVPLLFYYVPDFSTAMAIPTAVLFLHQGLWLYPWKGVKTKKTSTIKGYSKVKNLVPQE